jgi:Ca-activated chloride channel family protein
MRHVSVLALLLTLLGALLSAPAHAGDEAATGARVDGRLVLVLDSSGSMQEPAPGGATKIEAARDALTGVVESLPDDAEVGMRVFGATVFSRRDKGACADTQNVVPVGPLDREALAAQIAAYEPYGETPIGNALRGAARDLGGEGKRTIVLLSDGEPTCAPDPCRVARDLRERGVDLTVNVVGLDVSGPARRKLGCIARAGGGTYYDVSDPDELAGSLVSVSVRALREFSVSGTPVGGGTTEREALELSAGQYTDTIRSGEAGRYYVVPKPRGWGLAVGVTARPPSSDATLEGFDLALRTPQGASCGDVDVNRTNVLQERAVVSAGVSFVPGVSAGADETCAGAERLLVEVLYDDDTFDKPFEMTIADRPPAENLRALPAAATEEEYRPLVRAARVPGDPQPVLGGAGFHDAPVLEPGVYADSLRPGEQLMYRVPVGWGQSARMTVTAGPEALAGDVLGVQGDTMELTAFTPFRQELHPVTYSGAPVRESDFYNGDEPTALTFATAPVRLRNAEVFDMHVDSTTQAGEYWFGVEMGRLSDETRFAAPLTIEVEVVGDVAGEPAFAGAPSPAAESSPADDTGGTRGVGDTGDGAAGRPVGGDGSGDAARKPGGPGAAPLLGLGAAVVAGAAGLGWWVGRRRGGASGS